MNDCDRFLQVIERQATRDATAAEVEALAAHCRDCPECRALCRVDAAVRAAAAGVAPDTAGLAEVRRAVLRQVRLETPVGAAALGFGRPGPRRTALAAALAATLAAVAVLGYMAGRRTGAPVAADPAVLALGAATARGDVNRDPLDSPFIFSNVRFEGGAPGDRLRLGFDVSAHLELERPLDDPLVAEIVSQTLLAGASPIGSRLKAAAIAARLADRRVRGALVAAFRHDSSPAVRLSALAALGRHRADPAVESAVLQSLANETSVQMRLLAIDFLAAAGGDRATLRRAVDASTGDVRTALQVRASQDLDHD